ncbi:DivIVA domain-containing protein [Mycoplasma phocoenae]|uniref:DivIVA domain-containing protein n=1 Tax=Mycoplasma phocoenae TaxID=754517 RepID=A0A858U6I1_9MOLU|nr:DivIVA domain-containing protein [Mycoplasma phocoenae]QJG67067.1 DivIVA domain-containing protein [Mycoplasma phocoenae]
MPKYINIDKIVKKKFSGCLNGYDPEEVDEFIDELIEDIKEYQETIKRLENDK